MANIKSAIKKIRSDKKKTKLNKFLAKNCKNYIKELKKSKDRATFEKLLPQAISKLDKLGNKNIIHRNNAARKKSALYSLLKKMA